MKNAGKPPVRGIGFTGPGDTPVGPVSAGGAHGPAAITQILVVIKEID